MGAARPIFKGSNFEFDQVIFNSNVASITKSRFGHVDRPKPIKRGREPCIRLANPKLYVPSDRVLGQSVTDLSGLENFIVLPFALS
jgi:hypothetical protein